MRHALAILLLSVVCLAADQITVIVAVETTTDITMDDAGVITTNTSYRYIFSAPQPVGQLQDAIEYSGNQPDSLTISNAIVPRVQRMLGWVGKPSNQITVVMPE